MIRSWLDLCGKRTKGGSADGGRRDVPEADEDEGLELSLGLSLSGSHAALGEKHGGENLQEAASQSGRSGGALFPFVSKNEIEGQDGRIRMVVQRESVLSDPAFWPDRKDGCYSAGYSSCDPAARAKEGGNSTTETTSAQGWHAVCVPETRMPRSGVREGTLAVDSANASAIWTRMIQRSASMRLTELPRDENDNSPRCLVRSSSTGANMMAVPFVDRQPASLVRQVSGTESLQDRNPSNSSQVDYPLCHSQEQAVHNWQMRKQLQVQLRQEARKRRKSILEQKQLKRSKREESRLFFQAKGAPDNPFHFENSSVCVTSRDSSCSRSTEGSLQHTGSKMWKQCGETPAHSGIIVADAEAENSTRRLFGIGIGGKLETASSIKANDVMDGHLDNRINNRILEPLAAVRSWRSSDITKPYPGPTTSVKNANDDASLRCPDEAYRTENNAGKPDVMRTDSCQDREIAEANPQNGSKEQENRSNTEEHREMPTDSEDLTLSSLKTSINKCLVPVTEFLSRPQNTPLPFLPASFSTTSMPYPFPRNGLTSPALSSQSGLSVPYVLQFLAPRATPGYQEDEYSACSEVSNAFLPASSGTTPYHRQTREINEFDKESTTGTKGKYLGSQNTTLCSMQGFSPSNKSNGQSVCIMPLPNELSNQSLGNAHLVPMTADPFDRVSTSWDKLLPKEGRDNPSMNCAFSAEKAQGVPVLRQIIDQGKASLEQSSSLEDNWNNIITKESHTGGEEAPLLNGTGEVPDVATVRSPYWAARNLHPSLDVGQKFGGSKLLANLCWVSTTGTGPNGKTINGVMHIVNKSQVRIVCTCHNNNMSPAEFVQHAGSSDLSNPERSIVVNLIPDLGQLASAPG